MTTATVAKLLALLGYQDAPGFLRRGDLPHLGRYRHVLREAFDEMHAVGVFTLKKGAAWDHFLPLVYVCQAADIAAAQQVHRLAWSQGVVPFLLIALPDEVRCCNGLSYASNGWAYGTPHVSYAQLNNAQLSLPQELSQFTARALRTSLVWNDSDFAFDSRVDKRLIDSLKALVTAFVEGTICTPLPRPIVNALVGRFLYMRCLKERRHLPQNWIPIGDAQRPTLEIMWDSFEQLERVFNGSIFPLTVSDTKRVRQQHLDLLFDILLRGAELHGEFVQYDLWEIDFAVVRTETLSAVYELFLRDPHREDSPDGAYYTPPFLVDYVLMKIEQSGALTPTNHIFDCAAGSGLFLVGAFRRVIESRMSESGRDTLPLPELHSLLTECIWATERNPDACHVAALSLYLTMLDYAAPADIADHIATAGRRKVFPTLVGRNILARDFFSPEPWPRSFPRTFHVIVANPPWQSTEEIKGPIIDYEAEHAHQTDSHRGAGLFFHKAISENLANEGRFGFLLHAKMIVSASANNFPREVLNGAIALTDIVNLSHMRRKLFGDATAPAILLCGIRCASSSDSEIRVYTPLKSSQPLTADGTPWAIMEDSALVESFASRLLTDTNRLIETLVLPGIDRIVLGWLRARCTAQNAVTLDKVLKRHQLTLTTGVGAARTGVPSKWVLGADYRERLGLEGGRLFHDDTYALPDYVAARIPVKLRKRFAGNVILIARSLTNVDFVERPVVFGSSLNAIHAEDVSRESAGVLRGIARYLGSDFARYCFALVGRAWSTDARRFEANELRTVPMPVEFLDAQGAASYAKPNGQIDQRIIDDLDMPPTMRAAFREFSKFRVGFQNGKAPPAAYFAPADAELKEYRETVTRELAGGRKQNPYAAATFHMTDSDNVGALLVQHQQGGPVASDACAAAMSEFLRTGRDFFHDSGFPAYRRSDGSVILLKPWIRAHWTIERAHVDAKRIVVEVMSAALGAKQ